MLKKVRYACNCQHCAVWSLMEFRFCATMRIWIVNSYLFTKKTRVFSPLNKNTCDKLMAFVIDIDAKINYVFKIR